MNSAYKRYQRNKHIKKKLRIMRNWCSAEEFEKWYDKPTFKGKLNKGKIHCGCPLCKPWKYPPYPPKIKYAEEEKEARKEIKEFLKNY